MSSPSHRVPAFILGLAFVLSMTAGQAAAVDERGWLSIEAGSGLYDPEQSLRDGPGFGLRAAGYLNRWVGIEGIFQTASPDLETPAVGSATFTHLGAGIIVSPDRSRWTLPYLYAGVGSAKVDRDDRGSASQSAFHVGAGMIARFGERLGFRLDARDVSYKQEGGPGRDTRVNSMFISGALTAFWFGRARDTDGDGTPDKLDRCPDTPLGAVVDAGGCPIDTDGDKVFDGLDRCPGTPAGAVVDAGGCPIDTDKDGVPDGIDQCDSTRAGVVVDAQGCGVDTDGDGVFDGLDQCAETPAGAVVNESGCPLDADGDGVPDGIDICPATPLGVAVNSGGCPIERTPLEQALLEDWMIVLSDIEFGVDSTGLRPRGIARVDSVGALLAQWPMLKVEIGVHVDDQPEPGFRVPLTQLRARALIQHLYGTFPSLDQKNYWITGYGDTRPVAPNSTSANRALNRRVEFRVVNPDVLAAEKARREAFGFTPAPRAPGLEPRLPPSPGEGGEN